MQKFNGDFYITCADLSLRCPGFAKLKYTASTRTVEVVMKSHLDNNTTAGKKKTHGEILHEISLEFFKYISEDTDLVCVRERGVSKHAATTQCLFKVVGLTDFMLWKHRKQTFIDMAIQHIKKILGGERNTEKDIIAKALVKYVGEQTYANDNESDAVAVGITWLIDEGYVALQGDVLNV